MKRLFTLFVLVQIFSAVSYAQGPGEPFHPETANGARYIDWQGHTLRWKNPLGTIYNKVYFSIDSIKVANLDESSLIYNGFPDTAFSEVSLSVVGTLQSWKKYYWRVVEYDSLGSTPGPVWHFRTKMDVSEEIIFDDDFSQGLGNWIITNDGENCIWQIRQPPYPSPYWLPHTSSGNILSADSDRCGSGTTLLSTATAVIPVEDWTYFIGGKITWDNDWRHLGANSAAYVEISSDNGVTWQTVWQKVGESKRNSSEKVFAYWYNNSSSFIYLRFRSVQPGWHWWWAIDNVRIEHMGIIEAPIPPRYLSVSDINPYNSNVTLTWLPGWIFIDPIIAYIIERKDGAPLSSSQYQIIGQTSPQDLSFVDTTAQENEIYTYRVYFIRNIGDKFQPSNEVTVYLPGVIPVELYSFTTEIFNNDVILNWSTATETNNSGFEIQRASFRINETTPLQEWETIGFVPGNGTTTEHQFYSFTDKGLYSGSYLFRLKQIDFDGSFEYSNNIEVNITSPSVYALEQNYPNPFNPNTRISWQSPVGSWQTLKVYDVLGNEVATLVNEYKPAGSYEIIWDATGLSSGVYFYRLQSGEFSSVKKLILMK